MPVGCLHVPIPPGMLERWVKNRNRLLGSLVPSWGMPPKRCETGIRTTSHSADSGISFELRSQSTVPLLAVAHGSVVHGHLLCTQYSGGRRRASGTRKRWIHCFSCPSMYRLCIRAPRSPISTKCPPRSRRAAGNPLSPGFISRLGDGDARNRNGLFNGTRTKLMTGSSGCGRGGSQGIEYLWTCGDHCANSTLNSLSGRYPAATDRTERSGPLGSYTVGKVHARLPLGRSRTLNRCGGTEGHPSCRVGEPWNIGATLACVF
jgi:hypothetical protein